MAVSLAVVSLTGIAGVVWQWLRAEAQRAQAEHNFREAHRLVNAFYTPAYTEGMLSRPGLESLHRELFRDLLGYYRDFLRQRRDDPRTARPTSPRPAYRVAALTTEQGDKADAIEAFRQAESLFGAALARDPGNRGVRIKQAHCLDHIARMEARLRPLGCGPARTRAGLRSAPRAGRSERPGITTPGTASRRSWATSRTAAPCCMTRKGPARACTGTSSGTSNSLVAEDPSKIHRATSMTWL